MMKTIINPRKILYKMLKLLKYSLTANMWSYKIIHIEIRQYNYGNQFIGEMNINPR